MPTPSTSRFSWLHLTDLHQGMSGQRAIWPDVREAFFEDLRRLHEKTGPWIAVLFTGDLTQRGDKLEFAALDDTLGELWRHFAELGSAPVLLAVPGNHDLVRPSRLSPTHRVLERWMDHADVHEEMWADGSEYRAAVEQAFGPYQAWWNQRAAAIPRAWALQRGLLPGDWSVRIPVGERKVGVVGLNSAYVQLTGEDFQGKLHLDIQQFHGACRSDDRRDGPAWANDNDVSLLLTHHGPDWLSPDARDQLRSGIDVPPRFLAHLHGHMHSSQSYVTAEAGAMPRRRWQGCSLFGLEHFAGQIERAHGYAAGCIEFAESQGTLRTWPRTAVKNGAGFWSLGRDREMVLDEDGGTRAEQVALRRTAAAPDPAPPTSGPLVDDALAVATEHLATIEAYKNLHDELHGVELLCLRPLIARPTAQQLRNALSDLKNANAELIDQIENQGQRIDKPLATMLLMEVGRAVERITGLNQLLRDKPSPAAESAAVLEAIEELEELIGRYPNQLEQKLASANTKFREDPRLLGVAALEQSRRELEGRVEEHTWLQKIDGELRGNKGSRRHWLNVEFMLTQVRPVSSVLREAWRDIEDAAREVRARMQSDEEFADAIAYFGQLVAGVFRNVDADLKRLLGRLVKSGGAWGTEPSKDSE